MCFSGSHFNKNTSHVKGDYSGTLSVTLLTCLTNLLSGVSGLHFDLVNTESKDLNKIIQNYPKSKFFSAGLINGRNIWKNNLSSSIEILKKLKRKISKDKLIVSSSCSLIHSPVDLNKEEVIDKNIKDWLAFADQKLIEIVFVLTFVIIS